MDVEEQAKEKAARRISGRTRRSHVKGFNRSRRQAAKAMGLEKLGRKKE